MTTIRDAARITRNGRVTTPKALVAAVVHTCAASTCTETVLKDGNFCSMTCALTPKEAPVTDHIAPCKDMMTTCIDLECQVRKSLRSHLLLNVAEKDRPQASKVALVRLDRLINDAEHGHQTPEFFLAHAVQAISDWFDSAPSIPVISAPVEVKREPIRLVRDEAHVQAPKAVLTTTTKNVRKPRTAKIQPRITDNKEHPVTERITMTKDEMARAIEAAAERLVAERVATIRATPVVAPEDKPVTIVAKTGGRVQVQRATAATREYKSTVLPAIVVSEALTIPALEVGEESIDTVVSSKERSPYNKARFRLDKTPTALDKDTTTYRVLVAEHLRITALVASKPAKTVKAAPVVIAAVVDPAAKALRKAQVQALVTTLGITKAEAKALLDV